MIRNGTNLLFVIAGLVWSRSWRWRGVACCMLVVTALLGCLRMCIVLVLVRSVLVELGGTRQVGPTGLVWFLPSTVTPDSCT